MARLAGMRWREWLKYAGENGWFYSSANTIDITYRYAHLFPAKRAQIADALSELRGE